MPFFLQYGRKYSSTFEVLIGMTQRESNNKQGNSCYCVFLVDETNKKLEESGKKFTESHSHLELSDHLFPSLHIFVPHSGAFFYKVSLISREKTQ